MPEDLTDDLVLGGRLRLKQPRQGHRVGHDAILLAAATAAQAGEHAIELGAGVGGAGLALAYRIAGLRVTLIEIDPALAALATTNAKANGFSDRVSTIVLDVAAPPRAFAAAGLPPGSAQHVLMNPPFNDAATLPVSPHAGRARAHAAADGLLPAWIAAANRLLAGNGDLIMIWRADGLKQVLDALRGFGGIAVRPMHPRADAAAVRILLRAVKGSRAPMRLLPGLVLNDAHGRPSAAAEAILRDAETLPLA